LTAAACLSALFFCTVWCSTFVKKSIVVFTVLLLFEMRGTNPQSMEFIKTMVMSQGGFSMTNMQPTVIKYNVLVEKLF